MKIDDRDEKLKRLFGGLRLEEAARAPSFDRILRRESRTRQAEPWFSLPSLSLAGGAVALATLALSLTLIRPIRQAPTTNLTQWTALSNWRASTDGLLASSDTSMSAKLATPTDSWIENTPTSKSTEPNQKETP